MGRFNNVFAAVALTVSVVVGSLGTAYAAPVKQGTTKQVVLSLPERADILNRMAIHNAMKGDPKKAAHFFLRSFHMSRQAKDKKRAIRAISNLKQLEKKYGKTAIMGKRRPQNKAVKPVKPYNMPDWRKSHEA